MSKLICVLDSDKEIVEGSLGFFKVKQLEKRFPNGTVECLEDSAFPKDYRKGHYAVEVKEETGAQIKYLVRKDQAVIDAIPLEAIVRTKKAQEFYDVDAAQVTGDLKIVVEYLQELMGK